MNKFKKPKTMKKIFTLVVIILYTSFSFAQKAPLKWKKLTKEEIELKVYNDNPNIPAVVLYDYGQMYFDINPNGNNLFVFNKRHVRIKILNEEGLKYANLKFLYNEMNCEQYYGELSYSVKAVTHNLLENGKRKTSKVKYKNIKHTDSTGCIKIAEFDFPDVKVGSIIEYIVTIPSFKLIKPDTWHFQSSLPVIHSEFRARIPDNFKYIFNVKNINELPEQDSSYYDRILNYRFKYNRRIYNSVLNLSGVEYRFVNKFMPTLANKKDAEKINIHLKRIESEAGSYAWQKLTKALMITTHPDYDRRTPGQRQMLTYPAGYIIYYLPTWEEMNTSLLFDNKFGLAIIKHWDCDSILQSIIKPTQTELENTEAIYNYVKTNMKWNNEYSLYADVSDNMIKKLYSKMGATVKLHNIGNYFNEGKGTSAEINFVLMHLLNKVKIKVHPVLTNTTDNEILDKDISEIRQFKTTIALVEINNEKILLDAANPKSSFNKVTDKLDKEQMFIVRMEDFGWFDEK